MRVVAIFLCFIGLSYSWAIDPTSLMPREKDTTSMWWADGFPTHFPDARWHRCAQTGNYGFVLDTDSLTVPHFGAFDDQSTINIESLPPAKLALRVDVDGKSYQCVQGGTWTRTTGPRLIESGPFLQRADVTDLVFESDDGQPLNVDARFETVAWPDRLGLILAARPGRKRIVPGDSSFGQIGGGFGLDGTNHLEIPHPAETDSAKFTMDLWAFVPTDHRVSQKTFPWLVCKSAHEAAEGNFGIIILHGIPQARLNIGGGGKNSFTASSNKANPLKFDAWNHLAISYDDQTLRLYVNGKLAGETAVDRPRIPNGKPIAFGRRQDNFGDGYRFRGVIDEVKFYDRALSDAEIKQRFFHPEIANPAIKPAAQWCFRTDGQASQDSPREQWKTATIQIELQSKSDVFQQKRELPASGTWQEGAWQEVALTIDPAQSRRASNQTDVVVQATERETAFPLPVAFDPSLACHRINLDGIKPIVAPTDSEGPKPNQNDAMERVRLVLSNPSDIDRVARLMFEKTAGGFRHRFGAAITGMSAILRDSSGEPTGIPIQLSKNWHNSPRSNDSSAGVYSGQWFHAITQVRLPAGTDIELELSIVYGHWGGVAAASHSQLSLIGWGSNQLWHQSALGSWGESICYEPDQAQANCTITDVRPMMVRSTNDRPWNWTCNVGGGDFFRFFDAHKTRVPHSEVKTTHQRGGPCLTEVTYAGRIADSIQHSSTVSLARTDDIVRGVYCLRMDVSKTIPFSRFVIFQIGADTYNSTHEGKFAVGDASGVLKEWNTQGGGDVYRGKAIECSGRIPWASLHEGKPNSEKRDQGAWANRGIVIRSWRARLGGKDASPWMAEHGISLHGRDLSTLDIVPPPDITELMPGDFVEATIEHVIMPQFADDYYGPSEGLRSALAKDGNTWKMIYREAVRNDRSVRVETSELVRLYPDICIATDNDEIKFTLTGGIGYVPITFSRLTSPKGHTLMVDGKPIDQGVHGNDYWQTDYDPATKRWSQTYNIPQSDQQPRLIHFQP